MLFLFSATKLQNFSHTSKSPQGLRYTLIILFFSNDFHDNKNAFKLILSQNVIPVATSWRRNGWIIWNGTFFSVPLPKI